MKQRLGGLSEKEVNSKEIGVVTQAIVYRIVHCVNKRRDEKDRENGKDRLISQAKDQRKKEERKVA